MLILNMVSYFIIYVMIIKESNGFIKMESNFIFIFCSVNKILNFTK